MIFERGLRASSLLSVVLAIVHNEQILAFVWPYVKIKKEENI